MISEGWMEEPLSYFVVRDGKGEVFKICETKEEAWASYGKVKSDKIVQQLLGNVELISFSRNIRKPQIDVSYYDKNRNIHEASLTLGALLDAEQNIQLAIIKYK